MLYKYWVHFRAECTDTTPMEIVEQGMPIAQDKPLRFEDIGNIELAIANAVGAKRQSEGKMQGGMIMVAVLSWTKFEEQLVIVPTGARIN